MMTAAKKQEDQSLGWKVTNFLMLVLCTIITAMFGALYMKFTEMESQVSRLTTEVALVTQFAHALPQMEWRERVIRLEMLHKDENSHMHNGIHGTFGDLEKATGWGSKLR